MEGPAGAGPSHFCGPAGAGPSHFCGPAGAGPSHFCGPAGAGPSHLSIDIQRDAAFNVGLADGVVEIAGTVCDVGEMA